jgi:hypothetical protein
MNPDLPFPSLKVAFAVLENPVTQKIFPAQMKEMQH